MTAVLEATDVRDIVLAGHSMGGMTIMSLATHRPEVLRERAKAAVLVSTAATSLGDRFGAGSKGGQRDGGVARRHAGDAVEERTRLRTLAFGDNPVRAHMDLTRDLFGACHGTVRGDFLLSISTMDLLEGVATMAVPTTVMVGTP